jgi:hypothetical protein
MARLRIEATPNPNALKVTAPSPFCNGSKIISNPAQTQSPLAKALLAVDGVTSLFFLNDFVTISKKPEADWNAMVPHIQEALGKHPHFV